MRDKLPVSLQQLAAELAPLRQRVADLEDARDLDAAIRRDAGQPLLLRDDVEQNR